MRWLLLILLVSCAQVTSLNLKKHQFGLIPTKIIWFQVAGLEEEQLAMIRFLETAEKKTSFEENICYGQTWNYNLYNLRNSAHATFLSQITGKKNIKNTCKDLLQKPIWNYIYPNGYDTAIIESGGDESKGILALQKCVPLDDNYLKTPYIFIRSVPPKDKMTFHYSADFKIGPGQILYDRSCVGKICGSSIRDDFNAIYAKFRKVSSKQLVIVRDFTYLEALEKKDFATARDILMDIEKAYGDALKLTESSDYLVLLTTGDSRFVDMPEQGKSYFEFEKNNKNVNLKRVKLTNLVLASGARAENFCGVYEDSEIFTRILSGARQQGLELKIINPFN